MTRGPANLDINRELLRLVLNEWRAAEQPLSSAEIAHCRGTRGPAGGRSASAVKRLPLKFTGANVSHGLLSELDCLIGLRPVANVRCLLKLFGRHEQALVDILQLLIRDYLLGVWRRFVGRLCWPAIVPGRVKATRVAMGASFQRMVFS